MVVPILGLGSDGLEPRLGSRCFFGGCDAMLFQLRLGLFARGSVHLATLGLSLWTMLLFLVDIPKLFGG